MNCQDAAVLLHGFLDDELNLAESVEFQRQLESCPSCAQRFAAQRALRTALRNEALYAHAPAGFDSRIRASIHTAGGSKEPQPMARIGARAVPRRRPWVWVPAMAAAVLVVALLGIWTRESSGRRPPTEELLAQEAISSHIRSLMPGHLIDVPSSDQHTVKPWFAGRLDFSPPVKDLTPQGFTLTGGRLDYLAGRPVAALVYERRRHVINLMLWPAPGETERSPAVSTRQGYNLLHWDSGGVTYWAVSDLNREELTEFANLIRQ